MVILARTGIALFKVALQRTNSTGMEGYQSAFAELGHPHDQTVRCSVVSPQAHCLGETSTGHRQEPEACVVGMGTP